ncbi:MAG: glucose-1-phosphate adenylyltransferase, partial [Candidatus Omnitrophica bacterium]|nr:glucose-1-phosphate adenylyltransferase [Candidatus Omnitrophota bacterium]
DLTVSVVEMVKEKAFQLGVVEIDGQSRLIGFEEKPEVPRTIPGDPEHVLVSMGIYIFNKDVIEKELITDSQKKDSTHDFGKDIVPSMLNRYRVFAYNFKDENKKQAKYWRDIGSIDAYWEANMDLARVSPEFNLYDNDWPIRTYQEQFPPVKTVFAGGDDPARMGVALDSMVSNGCIISGGKVLRSILPPNVRVNSFAEVIDSIVMERVEIGRHARIKRAIIDKDVKIPQGMEIGYNLEEDKKRFTVTPSGIVVVAKGTVIEK